jgi:hypothetical protein
MANRSTVAERLTGILFVDLIILTTNKANINKQNFRYWKEKNTHQLHQLTLYGAPVTVRCEVEHLESEALIIFNMTENAMKCM